MWHHQFTSNFSHFSRTEKFPLVARYKHAKLGADPKRVSGFPKGCSLTGFKNFLLAIPFTIETLTYFCRCSRVTIYWILLQEQYPIKIVMQYENQDSPFQSCQDLCQTVNWNLILKEARCVFLVLFFWY